MTPEGKLKARWAKEASRHEISYINLIFTGEYGDPDKLILVAGGRPIFAEFKAPGGRLSAAQRRKIALYRNLGYYVRIIDSLDAIDELVNDILETKL